MPPPLRARPGPEGPARGESNNAGGAGKLPRQRETSTAKGNFQGKERSWGKPGSAVPRGAQFTHCSRARVSSTSPSPSPGKPFASQHPEILQQSPRAVAGGCECGERGLTLLCSCISHLAGQDVNPPPRAWLLSEIMSVKLNEEISCLHNSFLPYTLIRECPSPLPAAEGRASHRREAGLRHLSLLPPMHTLVWGDVPSVMSSSAVGILSCHSQGEANLPLLGLTPYFALPYDLKTFSLQFPDLHSFRKACR